MRSCTCVGYGAGSIQPRVSIHGMLWRAQHRLARYLTCLFALFLFFCLFPQQARAQWSHWESLGGNIIEAPSCVSWGENRIDCFARSGQAMLHRWWNGTQWGGWESLGGSLLNAPNCVSWGANRIDCFVRWSDQAMWHRAWDGSQWGGWETFVGGILESPNCVSWGEERIDCFARGADHAMLHRWWDGHQWLGWENLGGAMLGAPNCVSREQARIDCFAQGPDQAMWHIRWDGVQWHAWESLAGVILESPNCVSWAAKRLDCFARGPDQAMRHIGWTDRTGWGGWENLGGAGAILSAPNCVSWTNHINCFVRWSDQAIRFIEWDGTQWTDWVNLGFPNPSGGLVTQQPACVSWGPNRIDCFTRGADGSMFQKSWECIPCDSVLAVSTYHYDTLRTGWNSHERVLTAQNVASSQFGLLQVVPLDDQVDAQPLFVAGQDIAGGTHDVIYTATAANTVYAIDASTGAVLQTQNLGVPVPQFPNCPNNAPNIGISSTPVIDVANNTLYVMAYTLVSGNPAYQLHALDLDSFTDKVPPVVVAASHTRTDGSTYNFMAGFSRQRSGLLFANGNIYAGFASFCDKRADVSRGWLLGWEAATLRPLPASQLTNQLAADPVPLDPTQSFPIPPFFLSSIWMSGYALAKDEPGNVFFVTGNSDSDQHTGATSYNPPFNLQESVVKVPPDLSTVVDYFTPSGASGVVALDQQDLDFGSGGVMLLPIQPGPNPRLAVAAGKAGQLFLLNREGLGFFNANGPNNVLGSFDIGKCWCGPSYFLGSDGVGRVVTSGGNNVEVWKVQTSPKVTLVQEGQSAPLNGGVPPAQDPGFFTSVSSNGQVPGTAIIWAVARPIDRSPPHVTLYAFDASNGATLFSAVAGTWPNVFGNANIVPVVANGKVYVASNKGLAIFGLGTPIPFPQTVIAAKPPLAAATPSGTHVVYGTRLCENGDVCYACRG